MTQGRRDAAGFFALVALGVGLLYLRDPHSLLLPTLYTEDGAWMAKLFNRGFWHTLIFAKGGDTPYFVTLNILLLQTAKSLNALCYGDSLARLPHFVSALAMIFYAVLAAAPVWLLRGSLTPAARGLLWALVLFMPLGTSSFEVLGRLSNIGYGLLFLCVCLLAWRRQADRALAWRIVGCDAAVWLCVSTNPLCYPVVAADYVLRGRAFRRRGESFLTTLRGSAAARSAAVLAGAIVLTTMGMMLLESRPSPFLKETVNRHELVEAVVARPLVFPFLFPIYSRLTDAIAVAVIAGLAAAAWWLSRDDRRAGQLACAAAFVAAYAAVATVASRPGLTRVLSGYSTTMLDRYYYGTSLCAVLAMCAALSAGTASLQPHRRRLGWGLGIALVAIYATSAGRLVEFSRSRWPDQPSRDFATTVAEVSATPAVHGKVKVPLHPQPWAAPFPASNVRATAIALEGDTLRR